MSKNAQLLTNKKQLLQFYSSDLIYQKPLSGKQYSVDVCIKNGKIFDYAVFQSFIKNKSFYLFKRTKFCHKKIVGFVAKHLHNFTGIINIEFIKDTIIEVHLRPSCQFIDLMNGMIEDFTLYLIRNDRYKPKKFVPGVSRVYRRKKDCIVEIQKYPKDILGSIQFCFEINRPLSKYDQDEHSFVYMVINARNEEDILNIKKRVKLKFIE